MKQKLETLRSVGAKCMNDKIGKYYAVVKILFPMFRQCCLLQGDKTILPLKSPLHISRI